MHHIKSNRQVLLSFDQQSCVYRHFDGTTLNIINGEVLVDRKLGLWLTRYQNGFELISDDWKWQYSEKFSGHGGTMLLIRNGGLGDLLMLTPLIRELNNRLVKVTLATQPRYFDLFDPNTVELVDSEPYPIRMDTGVYDAVVDLNGKAEKAELLKSDTRHRAQIFADEALVDLEGDYTIDIKHDLIGDVDHSYIVYVWSSSADNRNLTYDKHISILKRLSEHYVIFVIGENRIELPGLQVNNSTGTTSLSELIDLVNNAGLIVSPDTGIFHIARALNKPTITYFGAFPLNRRNSGKALTVDMGTNKCDVKPCLEYNCPLMNEKVKIAPCIDFWLEDLLQQVYQILPI